MKEKDMSKLHHLPRFGEVVKRKNAVLRDYRGGTVDMMWGWNQDASLDQIFALKKGKTEILLDYQEFLHYARAISMWKHETERMIKEAEERGRMGVRL